MLMGRKSGMESKNSTLIGTGALLQCFADDRKPPG